MKTCTKCKIEKDFSFFYKAKANKDGLCFQCIDCLREYNQSPQGKEKFYRYNHSIKGTLTDKKYNASEKARISKRKYKSTLNGKAKQNACTRFRQANKFQATPPWLSKHDKELMKMFYQRSTYLQDVTGIYHHVDHIYPLKGKNSCGLHVPWNLRVIPGKENESKGRNI